MMIMFIIAMCALGLYILILTLLQNDDNVQNNQFILVTASNKPENISVIQDDVQIFFHLKNRTKSYLSELERTKRSPNLKVDSNHNYDNEADSTDEAVQKIRKILDHKILCKESQETCKSFISKLESILKNEEETQNNIKDSIKRENVKSKRSDISDILKRETYSGLNEINNQFPEPNQYRFNFAPKKFKHSHSALHHQEMPLMQNHDGCLYGESSIPSVEYGHRMPSHHNLHHHSPHTHGTAHHHFRDDSTLMHKSKMHPQDLEITMNFLQDKHRSNVTRKTDVNKKNRDVECPAGHIACDNGDCIRANLRCDGKVDCSDVSDELTCDCKSRVDKARICDFYFDCPFGEDEMGCHGCSENMFSCGDLDVISQGTCFNKEQRCNNVVDCPNQKDELDCSILGPSLHKKPLFAVSNTEGFLQRNFKGTWYAVCENPYIWAHDACRREVGLVIGPPRIQYVPIDPPIKIYYLNTSPGGLIRMTNTCFNNTAVYVTCSDIPCGTRVLTKAQLLLENTALENQIFGRNKRFFSQGPYPYNMGFNRFKRYDAGINFNGNNIRNTRADGRVVGGKPSRPAAWPWMVALYRDGTFHCGGVIISHQWIMSAAHCVHEFWVHYYEVQVGMLRRLSFSPQEQSHQVTHVIITDNYNREDMRNDLSILKVKPAIQFSRWVRPICLPSPTTAGHDWMWGPPPKTMCTAVGWGATIEHGPDPDHMREVDIPIWEHCKHQEDQAGKEICAGLIEGGRDACQGDSGGPLLCRNPRNSQQWYLAGIVSHGDGCARKNEPGVYTRVSIFVKWIKDQILSTSLPVIQPKQECPGFRCESGLFKCLPKKRMCDKVIDCLNGEDERNCKSTDSFISPENVVSTTDSIVSEINDLFRDVDESKISNTLKKNIENTSVNPIITESITLRISTENLIDVNESSTENNQKHNMILKDLHNNDNNPQLNTPKTTTFNYEDELIHASLIETAFPDNSDSGVTDSIEIITSTPVKIHNNEFDTQTIKIGKQEEGLESMSAILQTKPNENSGDKNLDFLSTTQIVSDTSNILSTTEITSAQSTTLSDLLTNESNIFETVKIETKFEENSNTDSHELVINFLPPDDTNNQVGNKVNITNNSIPKINSDRIKEISNVDINNIEKIVMADLEPANIRKKHTIPEGFQCQRIPQTIDYEFRCDGRADCEDGSDEYNCTCIDYLTTFDKTLICDGGFDCSEGEDENDCFACDEDKFLCKQSQMCLSAKHVCDGIAHCPRGEDELDCYTLSDGMAIVYDFDGKPKVNLEGYLSKKDDNEWHIICEDNLTILQQEQAAMHICRYLGFSSANRYFVKHINVKDVIAETPFKDNKRKRSIETQVPVKFMYRGVSDNDHKVIEEPEVLKPKCVPNITKVCMSLYVLCDSALFTDFNGVHGNMIGRESTTALTRMWPWTAKIFVDGYYKCTGVLLDVSWVVISHSCLKDFVFSQYHLKVILGSHKTLSSINSPYEQIFDVDIRRDLYRRQVILLHLVGTVKYTSMVKPMKLTYSNDQDYENDTCLAIGQNDKNHSITVFVKETNENCESRRRCFVRESNTSICDRGAVSVGGWSGIITCHSKTGWYPAASFSDSRGECGIGNRITATEIGNLKYEFKYNTANALLNTSLNSVFENCIGVRCSRGRCVPMRQLCDGIKDCEDGMDETDSACEKKNTICAKDPDDDGCECRVDQMKCRNGRCVSKELFGDGRDNCMDGTDEPGETTCAKYLSRVMRSRICDGVLHCHDRSDEDPSFCKCFAKRVYKCSKSSSLEDYCVASDMVCDGVRDCPNGEDEKTCIGLNAPKGTPHGTGKVIIRAHGVWYTKCYPKRHHTKSELEAICRELGFIGGHAKQLEAPTTSFHPHNSVSVDTFSEVLLNNKTIIKLRNTHLPIAKAIVVENLENCYPVYIECL